MGRLTAQWPCGRVSKWKTVVWLCSCECGSLARVRANNLRTGNTESCGCLTKEHINKIRASATAANTTHGMSKSPEYRSYHHAMLRCSNPNSHRFEDYGGRGIRFCFVNFQEFYKEVGPRPKGTSLDRINPDGHYEAGNVRWATSQQQARNKRCDRCVVLQEEIKRLQTILAARTS